VACLHYELTKYCGDDLLINHSLSIAGFSCIVIQDFSLVYVARNMFTQLDQLYVSARDQVCGTETFGKLYYNTQNWILDYFCNKHIGSYLEFIVLLGVRRYTR
jgi:hypothetical protein